MPKIGTNETNVERSGRCGTTVDGGEAVRQALEGIQPGEVREIHIPMRGEA